MYFFNIHIANFREIHDRKSWLSGGSASGRFVTVCSITEGEDAHQGENG